MSTNTDTAARPVGQADRNPEQYQTYKTLSSATKLETILARSTGVHHFWDKLRFLDTVKPPADLEAFLRANAKDVRITPDKLRFHYKIEVFVPNPAALLAIAAQDPFWHLVYAEPAREVCFAHRTDAVPLHHFYDAYFVHSARHRLRIITNKRGETIPPEEAEARRLAGLHTTYTGGRDTGFGFAWYSRFPSKITGEPCLKFEARIKWAAQLKRFDISTANLYHFPIRQFLADHDRLAVPDPVPVARNYLRDHPQQRLPPVCHHRSGFVYDPLRSLGNFIIRVKSLYPENHHEVRTSQSFVTAYRSCAFLRPI